MSQTIQENSLRIIGLKKIGRHVIVERDYSPYREGVIIASSHGYKYCVGQLQTYGTLWNKLDAMYDAYFAGLSLDEKAFLYRHHQHYKNGKKRKWCDNEENTSQSAESEISATSLEVESCDETELKRLYHVP